MSDNEDEKGERERAETKEEEETVPTRAMHIQQVIEELVETECEIYMQGIEGVLPTFKEKIEKFFELVIVTPKKNIIEEDETKKKDVFSFEWLALKQQLAEYLSIAKDLLNLHKAQYENRIFKDVYKNNNLQELFKHHVCGGRKPPIYRFNPIVHRLHRFEDDLYKLIQDQKIYNMGALVGAKKALEGSEQKFYKIHQELIDYLSNRLDQYLGLRRIYLEKKAPDKFVNLRDVFDKHPALNTTDLFTPITETFADILDPNHEKIQINTNPLTGAVHILETAVATLDGNMNTYKGLHKTTLKRIEEMKAQKEQYKKMAESMGTNVDRGIAAKLEAVITKETEARNKEIATLETAVGVSGETKTLAGQFEAVQTALGVLKTNVETFCDATKEISFAPRTAEERNKGNWFTRAMMNIAEALGDNIIMI